MQRGFHKVAKKISFKGGNTDKHLHESLITNPPFCVMNDVLCVCFDLKKPFVLLLHRHVTQTGVCFVC